MSSEDVTRKAAEIGLDLTPEQLAEFARATALVRHLADLVPRDLPFEAALHLPLSLQIVVAGTYEDATGWTKQHPPLAVG